MFLPVLLTEAEEPHHCPHFHRLVRGHEAAIQGGPHPGLHVQRGEQ